MKSYLFSVLIGLESLLAATVTRPHRVIAVFTFILVGVGVKLIFFSGPSAAADVGLTKSLSVDVLKMHNKIKNLPVEKFHDMTFVFSNGG
jgi:hypothetical protein